MTLPLDWPPVLDTYKIDLRDIGVDDDDDRFDVALQATLDAAVAYVQRVREDVNFFEESGWTAGPGVTADLVLGTIRLARLDDLWRDAPLNTLNAGDVGTLELTAQATVERLLRVGRYARLRFG